MCRSELKKAVDTALHQPVCVETSTEKLKPFYGVLIPRSCITTVPHITLQRRMRNTQTEDNYFTKRCILIARHFSEAAL